MERLHDGLWAKEQVNVIENQTIYIYQPQHWFRLGYEVNLEETTDVTASWVVAGIDRVPILLLYQNSISNEKKYCRLGLSCCNKLLTIL